MFAKHVEDSLYPYAYANLVSKLASMLKKTIKFKLLNYQNNWLVNFNVIVEIFFFGNKMVLAPTIIVLAFQ